MIFLNVALTGLPIFSQFTGEIKNRDFRTSAQTLIPGFSQYIKQFQNWDFLKFDGFHIL